MAEQGPRDPGSDNVDLPWNDVPADDDVLFGEPNPAEVLETEDGDDVVDVSQPSSPAALDSNHRDTLDERLAA